MSSKQLQIELATKHNNTHKAQQINLFQLLQTGIRSTVGNRIQLVDTPWRYSKQKVSCQSMQKLILNVQHILINHVQPNYTTLCYRIY